MTRSPHRPSQRTAVLEATLGLLGEGGSLSLDSAARAAGLTKPGLMYHFATKESLVTALIEHLIDGYERDLATLLPKGRRTSPTDCSAHERLYAYAEWAITFPHGSADLVVLADPKLRAKATELWAERLRPWVEIPADLLDDERARLHAVRLLADGCWFADATDILPVPSSDRPALLTTARCLLERGSS